MDIRSQSHAAYADSVHRNDSNQKLSNMGLSNANLRMQDGSLNDLIGKE